MIVTCALNQAIPTQLFSNRHSCCLRYVRLLGYRMPYPELDSQLFQQLQEPLHGSRASLPTVVEPAIDLRREGAPAVGSGSDWEAARGYVSLTSRRSHRREPTG